MLLLLFIVIVCKATRKRNVVCGPYTYLRIIALGPFAAGFISPEKCSTVNAKCNVNNKYINIISELDSIEVNNIGNNTVSECMLKHSIRYACACGLFSLSVRLIKHGAYTRYVACARARGQVILSNEHIFLPPFHVIHSIFSCIDSDIDSFKWNLYSAPTWCVPHTV